MENREIKFRVWMTEGSHKDVKYPYMYYFDFQGCGSWLVAEKGEKQEIIMQYTGLKDKHGKEIYEGDVLIGKMNYLEDDYFYKGFVYWFEEEANYWVSSDFSRVNDDIESCDDRFTRLVGDIDEDEDSTSSYELEVIGNVWENPELLK